MPRPGQQGPGKKNDNKGGGNNRGRRNFTRQATQMIRGLDRPTMRQLAQQEARARDVTQELGTQSRNVYSALQDELRNVGAYYEGQYPGIAQGLNENLAPLGQMQGSFNPGEVGASQAVLTAAGAGGQQLLASDRARNVGYGASTERQAAIEKGVVQQNYLEQLADALAEIEAERSGMVRDRRLDIKNLAFELRQAQFDRAMALKDLALRKAALAAQTGTDRAALALTRRQIENALDEDNTRNDRGRDHGNGPPPKGSHRGGANTGQNVRP